MAVAKGKSAMFNIELPYDQSGEVDWNTLGNILTAHLMAEVLCASYVDHKHSHRKADFRADTDWQFSYEKDDVVVLQKQFENSRHTTFMGRGVIEVPFNEVVTLVKDIQNNRIWDKFVVEAKYLKVLSQSQTHTDYIGYQRFETAKCLVSLKRDMLYYVRCIHIDGKYVQSALSVEDPDYPTRPDITRVEVFAGTGFVIEPYQGSHSKTLVSYLGNGDFKGLPQFIMTQVMKRHPLAIRYIRRHFVKAQQQQQKTHGARRHQLPQLERSTQAESDAIRQLPPASLYEEPWPTSHFMRLRSVTKGRSTSEPTVKKQSQTSQELTHNSTQSEVWSKQSPPSSITSSTAFYAPEMSSASEGTPIDIKNDCRVNSDMSAQTGNDPDSVDS